MVSPLGPRRRAAEMVPLKESIKIDAKILENPPTCDVGTSGSPGRTALGGVSSLSRKCSSLQQEVRVFSSFALFCD